MDWRQLFLRMPLFKKKESKEQKSFDVEKILLSDVKNLSQEDSDDRLSLHKNKDYFVALLRIPDNDEHAFALFKISSELDAKSNYSLLGEKLPKHLELFEESVLNVEKLQILTDSIRSNKEIKSVHLCALLGLVEHFSKEDVKQTIDEQDEETGKNVLHMAIEVENVSCVEELLKLGVKLDQVDKHGNTAFHYAAKNKISNILQLLGKKNSSLVNNMNEEGETALHVACLNSLPENVEVLLKFKADPSLTKSHRFPIHCALQVDCIRIVEMLCKFSHDQVNLKDTKSQGSPLHWATSDECISLLCDMQPDMETVDDSGDTPLIKKVRENLLSAAFALLVRGAHVEAKDPKENSSLHIAITLDQPEMVQLLIVFEADTNVLNAENLSPRHKAALSRGKNKDLILHYLHTAGAKRCEKNKKDCNSGCSFKGSFNGKLPNGPNTETDKPIEAHKIYSDNLATNAATERKGSVVQELLALPEKEENGTISKQIPNEQAAEKRGYQVLILDGGGLSSLSMLRILMAIEEITGHSAKQTFDWIAGSGSGAFIALSILQGIPLREIFFSMLELLTKVMKGSKPYDSVVFEHFLMKTFGEKTKLREELIPKVLVTGTIANSRPPKLHFFRNYEVPVTAAGQQKGKKQIVGFKDSEQFVWQAARCSGLGAAFFRPFGQFMDGSLLSNNPVVDALAEIYEFEMASVTSQKNHKQRTLHLVVSLGTKQAQSSAEQWDPYVNGADIVKLMRDQIVSRDERAVSNAKAWCGAMGVPCVRFDPSFLQKDEERADVQSIVSLLWDTEIYILNNSEKFKQLSSLLI